ncbi:MAG: homoserine kinase, partial [Casimicrobium sp.]
ARMSVFTRVTESEVSAWLTRFSVGSVRALTPISEGIENTNYFLSTAEGEFVLTLFERIPAEDLPFYLNFTAHLAKSGVAVPAPVADRTGGLFSILNGRPAAVTQRIPGRPNLQPSALHCAAVGRELGRLHKASGSFRTRISNKRGPAWTLATSRSVRPFVSADQNLLIENELKFQRERRQTRLPNGAIHADLFRDNVLFDGERLSGLIDFGFAATDEFAYDLAITANDWCVDAEGRFDAALLNALLGAYDAERPLTEAEQVAWPALLRAGALRFWLSRLYDLHLPRAAEINTPHDPAAFERILRLRIEQPAHWPTELTVAEK